ncbi:N-acetylmuramoyl-L-alanine amidase [Ruminococcus sp.]|uniref:N-acetylmuramoyl-L-alanine amidase n=1 Tax=Ruminococcus sp. TaxID=41978 RepID=UPI0025F4A5F3|nr:N-acetylmuramoyl-L-alanine amidase [Ruminococcus sp.]
MFRRLQSLLCCAVIGAFAVICWYGRESGQAVMTAAKVGTSMEKPVVVIDPGHGGMDGGCVSVDGTAEKGINLAISESLRDSLRLLGYDVICTRESDVSIYDKGTEGLGEQKKSDMKNRLSIFSKYSEGISVSIHQNQFTDSKYSGAQMFYSAKNTEGQRLAGVMQQQFVSLLQPDNMRETKPVGDELYLLNNTDNPAVMIECGFLSNPEEAAKLESAEYQKQVAFTVLTGITEYRGQSADKSANSAAED